MIACLGCYIFIRYRLRSRGYKKIQEEKFVPGKTAAYFSGKYDHSTSLPLTYPTTLQSGSPLVFPTFRKQQKKGAIPSSASFQSPQARTIKYNMELSGLNRASSLDDRLFRSAFTLKSADSKSSRYDSPLADSVKDTSDYDSTPKGDETEQWLPSEDQVSPNPDTDTFFYSHSGFIPEDDTISNVPSETDPVISYDQEASPVTKRSKKIAYLAFALEYQPAVLKLVITVKHAFDLQPVSDSPSGQVNSYVNLCIVPEDFLWQRTQVVKNDQDPVFNQNFEIRDVLYHKLREYTLCFYVMDTHPILGERVIGKVLYPLSELRAEQLVDVCKELSAP